MNYYTTQEKREWLKSWKSSGQSAKSFSKDKPFSASSLRYWKGKMGFSAPSSFIQVIPDDSGTTSYAKLRYPSGVVLEFYTPVESQYLKGLLE